MIERGSFLGFLGDDPVFGLQVAHTRARRNTRSDRRLLEMLTLDVRTRLAVALVELADRFGAAEREGTRIEQRSRPSETVGVGCAMMSPPGRGPGRPHPRPDRPLIPGAVGLSGAPMHVSLEELARETGEILMPYYGRLSRADAMVKGGRRRDLVSRADLEAEEHLLSRIPSGDAVLAEESGNRDGGGRLWLVDPLDGTVNFLHGIPFWCVSIALVEDGVLCSAAIHAPALGMTFTATLAQGAWLDGTRVAVSGCADVGDAILATGFPYARDTVADNNLDNIPRVGAVAGGLRRMGSAALDLAFTAAGRLDGFWELQLNPWDVAAGTLLVREAGGSVSDFAGDESLDRVLYGRNIVATNGPLHDPVRGLLAPLRAL